MKTVLPAGLKSRMEAGNGPGTEPVPPAFRVSCPPRQQLLQSPPAAWTSSMQAALSWRQVSPGHKARDLGNFRPLPGMESSTTSRAELHVTRRQHAPVGPLHPPGSGSHICLRAPAHPSNKGFLLLKVQNLPFVLTQTEIKAWMC